MFIILNRCTEFYQPAVYFYINIKDTLYYNYYVQQQLPRYNSIFYGSFILPVNKFISLHHWSRGSEIVTPQMGLYFVKKLFVRLGEASKNAFFFEVLERFAFKADFFLSGYFRKYYNWYNNWLIADFWDINKGGFADWDDVKTTPTASKSQLKIHFFEKPVVYQAPPQFWTCYVNKQFSFNSIRRFELTHNGIYFLRKKNIADLS